MDVGTLEASSGGLGGLGSLSSLSSPSLASAPLVLRKSGNGLRTHTHFFLTNQSVGALRVLFLHFFTCQIHALALVDESLSLWRARTLGAARERAGGRRCRRARAHTALHARAPAGNEETGNWIAPPKKKKKRDRFLSPHAVLLAGDKIGLLFYRSPSAPGQKSAGRHFRHDFWSKKSIFQGIQGETCSGAGNLGKSHSFRWFRR